MDAFYASVEQMDNPEYCGKPIAVGGNRERGVVAAASYEARKYGVKSAMASVIAARQCPELIFVKPRFERYKEISNQIRSIFYDYTDLVEPLSLDEAFLDVTENKANHPSASLLAEEIRYRIKHEVGLNASAGISVNKFVAKVASDLNKPNGQRTIPPEEVLSFLEQLPIEKFFGVGKVTADKMKLHGIFYGKQLKEKSLSYLNQFFGKSGRHFYKIVRAENNNPVVADRERKSIAAERTFESNLSEKDYMIEQLEKLSDVLAKRMQKIKAKGHTLTLKIKFEDFTQQTRSKTMSEEVYLEQDIFRLAKELLLQKEVDGPVRLLGISVTKLNQSSEQKTIQAQLMLAF